MSDAATLVDALRRRGATLACAESLTGGLLCATLVGVPGASDVVRGGVVAYAPDLKATLLDVDPDALRSSGTVSASTALAMARGVAQRLTATYGLSTTGVAGPEASEGKPVGTVHIAVAGPAGAVERTLQLPGDRESVRRVTVTAVLDLLREQL